MESAKAFADRLGRLVDLNRHLLLVSTVAGSVLLCLIAPRVAQWKSYHDFADGRRFLGIQHFTDFITNVPFLYTGLTSLAVAASWEGRTGPTAAFADEDDRRMYGTFGWAQVAVGVGSSIYHMGPRNETLFFDRLGMAVAFCTALAVLLSDRLGSAVAAPLFPFLIGAAVAGPTHWIVTELRHKGDLRFYALVQYLPTLLFPMLVLLYPSRYACKHGTIRLLAALVLQVAGKGTEMVDRLVWYATFKLISGHSMHHILSAAALYLFSTYIRDRRYIARTRGQSLGQEHAHGKVSAGMETVA